MKPNRRFVPPLAVALMLAAMVSSAALAAADKRLDRVKGTIGFQSTSDAPFHRIVGRELLPDDAFAVTQTNSVALLALPDSSIVTIGQATKVQVGAFTDAQAGPGSTIQVQNGALRFDIRRPVGGTANYHFTTTTSQLAIRGTVGLLSFVDGVTTVACLSCAADSVVLTAGGQTFSIITGQTLVVSAAGIVTTGAITTSLLNAFAAQQVSTSAASGEAAATAGIPGIAHTIPATAAAGVAAGAALTGIAVSGGFGSQGGSSGANAGPTQAPVLTVPLVPQGRRPAASAAPAPTPAPSRAVRP